MNFTTISKAYRENISKLVTFYNANNSDMKSILDDYLNGVDKSEFEDITNELRDNKYAKLEINLVSPYNYKVITPHK